MITASDEVRKAVHSAFEAGRTKDIETLISLHLNDKVFSKFSEFYPYTRQDREQALMHEELMFSSYSDYQYEIEDLRADIFGDMALATFHVSYSAVVVDNYTFEGKKLSARLRGTMVFLKKSSCWVIVHEHFSKFPD